MRGTCPKKGWTCNDTSAKKGSSQHFMTRQPEGTFWKVFCRGNSSVARATSTPFSSFMFSRGWFGPGLQRPLQGVCREGVISTQDVLTTVDSKCKKVTFSLRCV